MTKTWNVGTNAIFKEDFENMKVGDKCWIYKVLENSIIVLTKTDKDVPKERASKEVSIPTDRADSVIKCTVGKPRKDFNAVRLTSDDIEKILAQKN